MIVQLIDAFFWLNVKDILLSLFFLYWNIFRNEIFVVQILVRGQFCVIFSGGFFNKKKQVNFKESVSTSDFQIIILVYHTVKMSLFQILKEQVTSKTMFYKLPAAMISKKISPKIRRFKNYSKSKKCSKFRFDVFLSSFSFIPKNEKYGTWNS